MMSVLTSVTEMAGYAIKSSSPSMLAANWIDECVSDDAASMAHSTSTTFHRYFSVTFLLPGSRFWFILSQCGALFVLAMGIICALLIYDFGRYKLRCYHYQRRRQQRQQAAQQRQSSLYGRDQLRALLPTSTSRGCCAICLEDESDCWPSTATSSVSSMKSWTRGPACGHLFHTECMVDYAQIRLRCQSVLDCPICRGCFLKVPMSSEQTKCSSSWLY